MFVHQICITAKAVTAVENKIVVIYFEVMISSSIIFLVQANVIDITHTLAYLLINSFIYSLFIENKCIFFVELNTSFSHPRQQELYQL